MQLFKLKIVRWLDIITFLFAEGTCIIDLILNRDIDYLTSGLQDDFRLKVYDIKLLEAGGTIFMGCLVLTSVRKSNIIIRNYILVQIQYQNVLFNEDQKKIIFFELLNLSL